MPAEYGDQSAAASRAREITLDGLVTHYGQHRDHRGAADSESATGQADGDGHRRTATSLRPIHIGAPFPVGRGAEVPATVNMQLNVTPEDQGFDGDGPLVWSWSMAPDRRTGRWLITDEGTG